jgi:hypothetical protein
VEEGAQVLKVNAIQQHIQHFNWKRRQSKATTRKSQPFQFTQEKYKRRRWDSWSYNSTKAGVWGIASAARVGGKDQGTKQRLGTSTCWALGTARVEVEPDPREKIWGRAAKSAKVANVQAQCPASSSLPEGLQTCIWLREEQVAWGEKRVPRNLGLEKRAEKGHGWHNWGLLQGQNQHAKGENRYWALREKDCSTGPARGNTPFVNIV